VHDTVQNGHIWTKVSCASAERTGVAPSRHPRFPYDPIVHRSRLSTVLIDVPAASAASAAAFWSAALGVPARPVPGEEQFTSLPGALPSLTLAVQAVDDEARYHVDFETDDLDAETARLVGLGAVQIGQWLDCRILRAPGGHLLCVIPQHSDDFAEHATVWS
jgi:hypothetical protein